MRKILAFVAAGTMALVMSGCGGSAESAAKVVIDGATKGTIGVAMPTKTSVRWTKGGDAMKAQLVAAGYKVNLMYANDDVPTQVAQVDDMVTNKNQVLVVAAINSKALVGPLNRAKKSGIPVIAYDRLLRDTSAVTYYTTFDSLKVGELQAQSLISGLKTSGKPAPWNFELFAGSPDDNNAGFFYKGAMAVLQPLIDSGQIAIRSGEADFIQAATPGWQPAAAQLRMNRILRKSYASKDVQGVLVPNDGMARAIISTLEANGYGSGHKQLPVITGQDAELASVKLILRGEQYSTVFKDTTKLAAATVTMIEQITHKRTVQTNDSYSYHNGVKLVPTMQIHPTSVIKSNIGQVMLKARYYTVAQMEN